MNVNETATASQLLHSNRPTYSVVEDNQGSLAISNPSGQVPDVRHQVLRSPHDVAHNAHFSYYSSQRPSSEGHGTNPVPRPVVISHTPSIAEYPRLEEVPQRAGGFPADFEIIMGHSTPRTYVQAHGNLNRHLGSGIPVPAQRRFEYQNEAYGTIPYYPPLPPMPERTNEFERYRSPQYQSSVSVHDDVHARHASLPTLAAFPHYLHSNLHGLPNEIPRSSGNVMFPIANPSAANEVRHSSFGPPQGTSVSPMHGMNEFDEAEIHHVNADAITREDGTVVCSVCSEGYGNLQSWRRHATRVHPFEGFRMIPCHICRVLFRNEGNLRRHMRTAHTQIPGHICCEHCEATFTSERARSLHAKKVHANASGIVQGRVTRRRRPSGQVGRPAAADGASRRRSPGTAVHKCTVCDYVSKWKGNISRHYDSVHLKLRSHSCDVCHRRFNTSSNLAVHKMTHQRSTIP